MNPPINVLESDEERARKAAYLNKSKSKQKHFNPPIWASYIIGFIFVLWIITMVCEIVLHLLLR